MRGHGFAAAARSLIDVVRMSVYLPRNARVQFKAMQLGELKPLSHGEIDARAAGTGYKPDSPETAARLAVLGRARRLRRIS